MCKGRSVRGNRTTFKGKSGSSHSLMAVLYPGSGSGAECALLRTLLLVPVPASQSVAAPSPASIPRRSSRDRSAKTGPDRAIRRGKGSRSRPGKPRLASDWLSASQIFACWKERSYARSQSNRITAKKPIGAVKTGLAAQDGGSKNDRRLDAQRKSESQAHSIR